MEHKELSVDLIDQKRFAAAIREAMDCLDRAASCYKLTEKPYYLEVKEFLENKANRLEDINGSYLRSGEPKSRESVSQSKLKDFADSELTPGDPDRCLGNGEQGYECCCDNCDHYLDCFPEWDWDGKAWEEYKTDKLIQRLYKALDEIVPRTEADVALINRVVDTLMRLEGVDAEKVNKAAEALATRHLAD